MDLGLKGKVVLITGASSGIGEACAVSFAKEGAHVAIHCHLGIEKARNLRDWILRMWKIKTAYYCTQIADEIGVNNMFEAVLEEFGRIDICVANAGIVIPQYERIDQMPIKRFNEVIAVNLFGAWLTARAFFKVLNPTQPFASLIFVGSTSGTFGEEGWSDYCASKAALVGLTKTLKNEIIRIVPNGRVNMVAPGWTRTPMTVESLEDKELVDREMKTRAIARIADPIEVARQIVILSSEEVSSFVSGQIIGIDGGMEGRIIW